MPNACVVLNGKEIASSYLANLAKEIAELRASGEVLSLATVRVGEADACRLYEKSIENLLKKVGVRHLSAVFSENVEERELYRHLEKMNADPEVTGIMIFSPLPKQFRLEALLNAVNILKEVEGRRLLHASKNRVAPPTALAAVALFEATGWDATGKTALIIGRSGIVGKPAALLMLDKNATVTIAHSKTKDLNVHVGRADIVIASIGKPEFIKGDWIKPGAVVVDVGENMVGGKPVGDIEFEKAKGRAAFISPVPGGVGPVTRVMLVRNLVALSKLQSIDHEHS
ncbi:MAG: bifunctional 5,10-methylene-tetrahydrofolate dehydrogenase/5,10-methylene-tetrahydrofolate cyclohydrolase [Candidatus Omnitrophica bacterium CG07_land_8_20_14_0_80_50_8]|nr:MAG: hypothetical protein AUJ71_01200 [Candidatus Omnitrophica bacterium CG1_02_49_16]PIU40109.1 MAG: bifunctional 5,10-methylene-tetrahydrofolate dehydrogenase/5,10-methylene-tetrahydrofolate cyclohydrolase [Candidatus Omnitrophica bacterium CG07_land_8_20_14_0_80_50_8]